MSPHGLYAPRKSAMAGYGWMPHNAGFGFQDIAGL
jgi:hypothetical protein